MKIERDYGYWSDALHFGPFIEWQEWNLHHHEFKVGFSFGPHDLSLKVVLFDFFEIAEKEIIPVLKKRRGITTDKAWGVLNSVQRELIDRLGYKFNLMSEVKKELGL